METFLLCVVYGMLATLIFTVGYVAYMVVNRTLKSRYYGNPDNIHKFSYTTDRYNRVKPHWMQFKNKKRFDYYDYDWYRFNKLVPTYMYSILERTAKSLKKRYYSDL